MKKKFISFAIFTLSLLATCVSGESKNLVINGDFNAPGAATDAQVRPSQGDRIPFWTTMRSRWYLNLNVTPPIPDVSVLQAKGEGRKATALMQNINLEPGKTYTMSAWIRGEDLVNIPSRPTGLVLTNWGWTKGTSLADFEEIAPEWTRLTKTFVAPDEVLEGGVRQPCQLRVFLPEGETGTIWITAIQIEEGGQKE